MPFERTFYEVNPYLYAATGTATIVYPSGSMLMKASGFVLLFAAFTILGLRWIYRRDVHGDVSAEQGCGGPPAAADPRGDRLVR